ncbi:MAG: hypothetical protein CL949_16725 [Erythrobacter sp.]|nr:hypothetical protein [Erythrobacter sp.]|tara:strand:+ start:270 stop:614 length:345 start_codon:yes stop_codon:yes gene_type:complete
MTEQNVFESVRSLWSDPMDISDAKVVGESGFSAPQLFERQEMAFECAGMTGLLAAAVWPFHQALGELAERAHRSGKAEVSPGEVEFGEFRIRLVEALADESWQAEKAIWERLAS